MTNNEKTVTVMSVDFGTYHTITVEEWEREQAKPHSGFILVTE